MDNNGKNLPSEKRNMLLFMMLVQQYERIAQMNLGEIPNPAHNQIEIDVQSARFAIDTLEMLKAFSKGNITDEASEYLGSTWSALKEKLEAKTDSEK